MIAKQIRPSKGMLQIQRSFWRAARAFRNLATASARENHLEIGNVSTTALKFHYIWLRDHCRCHECYTQKTHQIISDITQTPLHIKPLSFECTDKDLNITWRDGHKSHYSLPWLLDVSNSGAKSSKPIVLWNADTVKNIGNARIPHKEYMKGEDGLRYLLESILTYGFGIVTDVEPTLEATQRVVEHMAPPRKTYFGEMYEVCSDNFSHEDSSYLDGDLGAHNDNTYFTEGAGLQVFHMLEFRGSGGTSLFVDGFRAAVNLREKSEESFSVLCNSPIESEYIDKGAHFIALDPVIRLHPVTKNLLQIRYNIYDRVPLRTLEFENVFKFYVAYKKLGEEIKSAENEWWIQLQPGDVFFIDNWRVLHGRSAYKGYRRLGGCYVSRRDWLSKANSLKLSTY